MASWIKTDKRHKALLERQQSWSQETKKRWIHGLISEVILSLSTKKVVGTRVTPDKIEALMLHSQYHWDAVANYAEMILRKQEEEVTKPIEYPLSSYLLSMYRRPASLRCTPVTLSRTKRKHTQWPLQLSKADEPKVQLQPHY